MAATSSERRHTRRRVPRAEREETMLDAAGAVFAARGFNAASMDAIAEAAGISKPMLYNYFGSKEGLYVAYLERSGQALLDAMRHAASRDAAVDQRLWAGILAFLTYVDEHRVGWSVLYREATSQGGPPAAGVAALRARIAAMVTGLFGSDAFAHAFVGAGESLANWWLAHPDEPKEAVAKQLMNIAAITDPQPGAARVGSRP
jgi:AcrR family transcriptional regulator